MSEKIKDLLSKLQFWYAKRFIKLNTHYTFFFDIAGKPDTFVVKYLKSYKDTIIEFESIKFDEGNRLNFNYDILANPNNHDVKSKRFDRFTSNVMRNIINGAIENGMREENENRNTDIIESDSKRSIHEEITTISETRVSKRKPRKKTVRRNKELHSEVQQSSTDSSVGDQP